MYLNDITREGFILALFIRSDNQRFLLGTGAYEFKDTQLHFAANAIQNDVVEVQGNDGYLLAGQVGRPSTQVFDGYVGSNNTSRVDIEQYRKSFFAFFRKNFTYTVVYIMADGSSIQRRRGFLVDAPTVQELYQKFPEYHVGLNFEDINYYNYYENDSGEEIYGKMISIGLSNNRTGGLVWSGLDQIVLTGEGTNFTIFSTIANTELDEITFKGDTTQQTYTGKNLLPFTNQNESLYGITAEAVNGNLKLNGNCTSTIYGTYNIWKNNFSFTLPAGTYTFSKSGTAPSALILNKSSDSSIASISATSTTSVTFTLNNSTEVYLGFYIAQGASYTNILTSLQLEEGSSPTSFEPYVGGTASPNPDYPQTVNTVTGEQTITISDGDSQSQEYEVNLGKNLFDKSALTADYRINYDGTLISNEGFSTSDWITVAPNTEYTITMDAAVSGYYGGVGKYTADGTFIERIYLANSVTNYTFKTDSNCYKIRFSDATAIMDSVQIEKGDTATTYAAYFTPIELCKIGNYQDYIYKSGDDWYIHKETGKYTILDTDVTEGADYTNVYFAAFPKQTDDLSYGAYPNVSTMYLSVATFKAYSLSWNRDIYISKFVASASGSKYWVGFPAGTSLATATTKITGGELYYALKNSTDTQITNATLVSELEAVLAGDTYEGRTDFSVTSSNLPSWIVVKCEGTAASGVTWDNIGAIWDGEGSGGIVTLTVDSIADVYPVWEVKGPADSPSLTNLTTGTSISYSGNVTSSQTLIIDMNNKTATLNGASVIQNVSGNWLWFSPGNNRVSYNTTNSDAPNSKIMWQEIVG